MQGGVCYNKAVPIAMAAFTGNEIIVPPEPGLMGAFGVALEIKQKIELGLLKEQQFDLNELSNREIKYANNFTCSGGKEKCDRSCQINMMEINGKNYPFGGACNKYVNLIRNVEYDCEKLDLVVLREKLTFEKYAPIENNNPNGKKIGISKSLLVNSLYPLYYNFFTNLGFNVVLGDEIDSEGIERKGSAFCYPVELAHGLMSGLIKKELNYIFLPQVIGMHVENGIDSSVVCPLVQGEPYYLKTAFKELKEINVISPVLNFSNGYHNLVKEFERVGMQLGVTKKECIKAYKFAFELQRHYLAELQQIGRKVISEIERNPNEIGIILFGRPYNAYSHIANMGIPHKFASRGYRIIPADFLPFSQESPVEQMYWSMGQIILKSASYVKKHPQLFGTYITNFSCGPDSFVVGYFRNVMGDKPSLTLELDSHTADAGLDTRVEAFLDVVKSYIEIKNKNKQSSESNNFKIAQCITEDGSLYIIDSRGEKYSLKDKKVHLLIPSMGDFGSRCLAACFRYAGVNATNVEAPNEKELKLGRANSSCKECLPLMLTVGSLLDYLEKREDNKEVLVYFMPETSGPCRFGQYNILMKNLIIKNKIENVALLSLTSENSYAGLGTKFQLKAWRAVIISDVLDDIYSSVLVLAEDKEEGLRIFDEVKRKIVNSLATESWKGLQKTLIECSYRLSKIKLKDKIQNVTKIGLLGEAVSCG
jgi:predicted nucleotide-binding protein (sugar kinase/HSP70/actin superfamily)